MKSLLVSVLSLFVLVGLLSVEAEAVQFDLSTVYTGTAPSGSPSWLTMNFSGSGTVNLTLSSHLQSTSEYITNVYFNLNPALNPTNLAFSHVSGDIASISKGTNAFMAPGDGIYDVRFQFPNSPPSGRFRGGELSTYAITCGGCAGFNANSFKVLGAPGPGSTAGPFFAVAKVQGIAGGEGSGHIAAVPIPGTLLMFGAGFAGFAAWNRRGRGAG